MLLSFAGGVYSVWRLHQQTGWGPAVRYAVGAMIVVWTPIEIAGKWGMLREPWLLLRPEAIIVFFGGLALGTWGLWRAQRRTAQKAPAVELPVVAEEPALAAAPPSVKPSYAAPTLALARTSERTERDSAGIIPRAVA